MRLNGVWPGFTMPTGMVRQNKAYFFILRWRLYRLIGYCHFILAEQLWASSETIVNMYLSAIILIEHIHNYSLRLSDQHRAYSEYSMQFDYYSHLYHVKVHSNNLFS